MKKTSTSITGRSIKAAFASRFKALPAFLLAFSSAFVAEAQCSITTFPHTENFDGVTAPALPCGWTILDANADTYTWENVDAISSSGMNSMVYVYNDMSTTTGGNDWLFTPPMTLDATKTYSISLKARVGASTTGTAYPEGLEIRWGSAANVASMPVANKIYDNASITFTTYTTITSSVFAPPTSGTYYAGFYVKSAGDQFFLSLDDIVITELSNCTGAPVAGTLPATLAICSGEATTLTATGATVGGGITYQWEESDDNGVADAWANAVGGSGATSTEYTLPTTLATSRYYRLKVTCTNSSQTSYATTQITIKPISQCYCTAGLHGTIACDATDNINTVSITGTTLNNANTGCTGTNGVAYTAYPATGSTTATLQQGSTYTFNVQTTDDNSISLWIDYNQNGQFEASEWTQVSAANTGGSTATVSVIIPINAVTGQTGMRVRSRLTGSTNNATSACAAFGSGETEDYTITISAAPACTGTPTAGTVAASAATICTGLTTDLIANGATAASGMVFQWEESDDNGVADAWANVTGGTANGPAFTTPSLSGDRWYRLKVTCTASGQFATSTGVKITVNSGAITSFPYTQNFDASTPPAAPCGFLIEDSNNDGYTWSNLMYSSAPNNQGMQYLYNDDDATIPGNDWFFTPAITMSASKEYVVSFDYMAAAFQGTTYPEKLEVKWGNAPTSAAMTGGTVFSNLNITNTTMTNGSTSVIRPVTSGTYHVGFHVISDPDQFFLTVDNLNIIERNISGVANELGNSVLVYPNPAADKVNIAIANTAAKNITVEVLNTLGQQVYTTSARNNQTNQVDLSELSNGIYFVKVRLDDKVGTYRISVQK